MRLTAVAALAAFVSTYHVEENSVTAPNDELAQTQEADFNDDEVVEMDAEEDAGLLESRRYYGRRSYYSPRRSSYRSYSRYTPRRSYTYRRSTPKKYTTSRITPKRTTQRSIKKWSTPRKTRS